MVDGEKETPEAPEPKPEASPKAQGVALLERIAAAVEGRSATVPQKAAESREVSWVRIDGHELDFRVGASISWPRPAGDTQRTDSAEVTGIRVEGDRVLVTCKSLDEKLNGQTAEIVAHIGRCTMVFENPVPEKAEAVKGVGKGEKLEQMEDLLGDWEAILKSHAPIDNRKAVVEMLDDPDSTPEMRSRIRAVLEMSDKIYKALPRDAKGKPIVPSAEKVKV